MSDIYSNTCDLLSTGAALRDGTLWNSRLSVRCRTSQSIAMPDQTGLPTARAAVFHWRIQGDNRPISLAMRSRLRVRSYILFQLDFLQEEELRSRLRSWRVNVGQRSPFEVTILFVPVSAGLEQLAACWANDCDQIIIRLCPICKRDSIVGHGHRRKQAHDEHHDWIGIRRGRCSTCGKTFTFLPLFSLPYTHFSLLARCQALWLRFKERCCGRRLHPR